MPIRKHLLHSGRAEGAKKQESGDGCAWCEEDRDAVNRDSSELWASLSSLSIAHAFAESADYGFCAIFSHVCAACQARVPASV